MRTLLKFAIIFSYLSTTTLVGGFITNNTVNALCDGIQDPNISCHEQYNSRSNTDTSTTTTTNTQDDSETLLCSDLKCNFGEEYLLDPESMITNGPFDALDY